MHRGAVYQVGNIKNKYLIIDILAFSIDDFSCLCRFLHSCSRSMRDLLKKSYLEMNIMPLELQPLERIVLLTHNYKTSKRAHQHLEEIVKRGCENLMKIDYGL